MAWRVERRDVAAWGKMVRRIRRVGLDLGWKDIWVVMWAAEEALLGGVAGIWFGSDRGGGLNVEKRLSGIVGGVRRCLV